MLPNFIVKVQREANDPEDCSGYRNILNKSNMKTLPAYDVLVSIEPTDGQFLVVFGYSLVARESLENLPGYVRLQQPKSDDYRTHAFIS